MRPLSISDATSVLSLQQEIQRSEESRYDHRLHGVLLVAQGLTCPEVAGLLGDAPRSVEYWVNRYQLQGLAGLTEGDRPGRPSRLSAKQMEEIGRALRSKPSDAGNAREPVGWQDPVGMDREGLWGSIESPPMSTIVPSTGLSPAQTPTGSGQGRSRAAEKA